MTKLCRLEAGCRHSSLRCRAQASDPSATFELTTRVVPKLTLGLGAKASSMMSARILSLSPDYPDTSTQCEPPRAGAVQSDTC